MLFQVVRHLWPIGEFGVRVFPQIAHCHWNVVSACACLIKPIYHGRLPQWTGIRSYLLVITVVSLCVVEGFLSCGFGDVFFAVLLSVLYHAQDWKNFGLYWVSCGRCACLHMHYSMTRQHKNLTSYERLLNLQVRHWSWLITRVTSKQVNSFFLFRKSKPHRCFTPGFGKTHLC